MPSRASRPRKPTAPHLVEPELKYVTDATFREYRVAVERGFQEEASDDLHDLDRRLLDNRRSFGFKVGRRWVSTFADFSRRITVPGGDTVPCAAVTAVTVSAPYRRRGLLTRMMSHHLERARANGDVLAVLWASESLIYGRFGYGPAADRYSLSGRTRRLAFLPGVRTSGSVDEVTREQYERVAGPLHEAMRPERPGAFVRGKDEWDIQLVDVETVRKGTSTLRHVVHYDDAGDADGFATYRFKDEEDGEDEVLGSIVQIRDLWAEDPAAYASLWRYLLDLDLARRFRLWTVPLDEPLRHLVRDARAIRTEAYDGLYVRLVDVEQALAARQYAADVDLVIEVDDPILESNSGRFRLVVDAGSAEVTRVTTGADLTVGILELGTIYLGGVPLTQLQRAGRVTEHTPGAVAATSTAFGWHRAPVAPDMF